ncbi:MAG: hypothetical protein JXR49_20300, partial [Acidobacteria bacterium]|nr:hypothetical protein [Acidobacteriota bacterium]
MKILISIIILCITICFSVFAGELPNSGQLQELCHNVLSLEHETQQNAALCANNAETPYPCYISVEGRDGKEDEINR